MNEHKIFRINDKNGNQIGLLKVEIFLDILDVRVRAKNKYGEDSDWNNPIYIGNID